MKLIYTFFFLTLSTNPIFVFGQGIKIPLTDEGFVSAWIVTGPFEQPLVGFGVPADEDIIGEKEIEPLWGKEEKSNLIKDEKVLWVPQSSSDEGFLDFNKTLRWQLPGNVPEKIWYAITGYAAAYVESPVEQKVILKFGSNSFCKILINGIEVFSITYPRN
ncbi:MAG: hypothetical protein EHM47_03560, partial [Ignavibacteriales bacterium]